jgi:hypothetical protein
MSKIPVPVAYSMSFDVELEMSLYRTGLSYSVALPLYGKLEDQSNTDETMLDVFWVIGDITPGDRDDEGVPSDLYRLRNVRPFQWDSNVDRARPLVVRLAGCPLYNLDEGEMAQSADSVGIDVKPELTQFGLALSYDEHFALRQSQVELLWASLEEPPQSSEVTSPSFRDRGLHRGHLRDGTFRPGPRQLAAGNQVRYWALLGVPTEDPGIRRRLMTLLNLRAIATMNQSAGSTTAPSPT